MLLPGHDAPDHPEPLLGQQLEGAAEGEPAAARARLGPRHGGEGDHIVGAGKGMVVT